MINPALIGGRGKEGTTGKPTGPMVHPEVLVETDVDQSAASTPTIAVDDRGGIDVSSDHCLKSLKSNFRAIRDDFCVDLTWSFQQAKDNGLAMGASVTLATNPVSAEVGLVDFNGALKRRGPSTRFGDSMVDLQVDRAYRTKRYASQFSDIGCSRVHHKTSDELQEFGLVDSRTTIAPIFVNHLKKSALFNMCLTS